MTAPWSYHDTISVVHDVDRGWRCTIVLVNTLAVAACDDLLTLVVSSVRVP